MYIRFGGVPFVETNLNIVGLQQLYSLIHGDKIKMIW